MREKFITFGAAVLLLSVVCNAAKAQAIITTADQLRAIGLTGNYMLMADITVDDWVPVGNDDKPFNGTFDGNGHTITVTGIGTVTPGAGTGAVLPLNSKMYYIGLFGFVGGGGQVKNLRMNGNILFDGKDSYAVCGSIAGYNAGAIRECISVADITVSSETYGCIGGGIAGINSGSIKNCYTTGLIIVSSKTKNMEVFAGGIAGANTKAISNCYATGSVESVALTNINVNIAGGITACSTDEDPISIRDCAALNSSVTVSGGGYWDYVTRVGFMPGKIAKSRNTFCCSETKITGRALGKNILANAATSAMGGYYMNMRNIPNTRVKLAETQVPSWWIRNLKFDYGGTADKPWTWDNEKKCPVLFWEKEPIQKAVAGTVGTQQPPSASQSNTKMLNESGTVKCSDKTYTVHLDSIKDNRQGLVTVYMHSDDTIKVKFYVEVPSAADRVGPRLSGSVPLAVMMVAGGESLNHYRCATTDKAMEVKFRTQKTPQKIIVYSTDNDSEGSRFVFDISEDMITAPARAKVTGDTPYKYCFGENNYRTGAGCSQIKVTCPDDTDMLVTLKSNGRVTAHAYIHAGNSFIFHVPDGTYQPFFYFGQGWDSEKNIKQTGCGMLRGGFMYKERFGKDSPQTLNHQLLTYELIWQDNGNFNAEASNSDEAF